MVKSDMSIIEVSNLTDGAKLSKSYYSLLINNLFQMSSERKIVEYKVFALRREEDWEDFENRIKEAIEDGWQPLG